MEYRPLRRDSASINDRGSTLLGVLLGLIIGCLFAFGIVWHLNKSPLPFRNQPEVSRNVQAKPSEPIKLPGKPGDKAGEKPRFEFHEILVAEKSGQESGEGSAEGMISTAGHLSPVASTQTANTTRHNNAYFLQAGSFQKVGDAENLKAQLALLGVEASVQEADVQEKGKVHRVRIGPFASAEEMNRANTQLAQGGVRATLVRQRSE